MNYKQELDLRYGRELRHYGVLGMRWGVRRARNGATLLRKVNTKFTDKWAMKMDKKAERIEGDYKKKLEKRALKKNPTKDFSDKELRDRINRLQMEKQYKELTPTTVSKGKKVALKILGTAATGVATGYITKGLVVGGKSLASTAVNAIPKMIDAGVLDQVARAMNKTG